MVTMAVVVVVAVMVAMIMAMVVILSHRRCGKHGEGCEDQRCQLEGGLHGFLQLQWLVRWCTGFTIGAAT